MSDARILRSAYAGSRDSPVNTRHRPRWAFLLSVLGFVAAGPSGAVLTEASTPACGSFGDCDDSAFIALVGGPLDVFLDFDVDKNGNPIPNLSQPISGDAYSEDVTFSTRVGVFGGTDSPFVRHSIASNSFEIGPVPSFDGILEVAFASPVSAVGFATVELGTIESIRVYGAADVLLQTFPGVSDDFFDYFGVVASGGDVITRVELDGEFFAIQNTQFSFARLDVGIDIKPGSDINAINAFASGMIPVAILGSDTFDVADVDATTLAFGPASAALAHRNGPHRKDANHDGVKDLLAHFFTDESGIALGATEACVTGELLDGTPFAGCDTIGTVPNAGSCGVGFELALLLPPLVWLRRRRLH